VKRTHQIILIGSTLLGSCLGMQAVHELGHVLGALATGAQVTRVVLTPTTISRTDVANNSRPLIVAWAGPIVGVIFPAVLWFLAQSARIPGAFVLRFFAGFCMIANGLYIGIGSFSRVGDCGEMLRHGSEPWTLWLFGGVTAPLGLALLHRQGTSFGFDTAHGQVSHAVAYASLGVCLGLLVLGFAVGGR
jgi:Peptidase M50B-like